MYGIPQSYRSVINPQSPFRVGYGMDVIWTPPTVALYMWWIGKTKKRSGWHKMQARVVSVSETRGLVRTGDSHWKAPIRASWLRFLVGYESDMDTTNFGCF